MQDGVPDNSQGDPGRRDPGRRDPGGAARVGVSAPTTARLWSRDQEPEFSRLANFSDAVYAIALTLLVLEVRPDQVTDPTSSKAMLDALNDISPQLIAFAIAFVLLGKYWMAHHEFFARVRAYDRTFQVLTLAYLAFVALLPFPSYLIGEYEKNPIAVVVFAVVLFGINSLEAALLVHAHRADLLAPPLEPDAYRWSLLAALVPLAVYLATTPLAFLSTNLTLICWVVVPAVIGRILAARAPSSALSD